MDSNKKDSSFQTWILIQQAGDALALLRERKAEDTELSSVELQVLRTIKTFEEKEGKQPTPSDLGRWLIRRAHSMSTLISRMEKRGLVTRTHDKDRKNLIRVSITEKGEDIIKSSCDDEIMEVINKLPENSLVALKKDLQFLRDEALVASREAACPFPDVNS